MVELSRRNFRISKFRLTVLVGLVVTTCLILFWLIPTNPLLFENPMWLFSKPSDEIIIKSLPSRKNIDYRPLRSLLQTQQWEKADRETQEKVTQLLGSFYPLPNSESVRSILTPFLPRATDISKIPCTDLLTIDLLWTKFSEGRFGFNIQRRIVENDSRLSSPEDITRLCLRQCPQEVPRTIQQARCKMGCESQRIKAQFERIPAAMGRGRSTVVNPLPTGYYPSPIKVRSYDADAYRELAKRVARCNI